MLLLPMDRIILRNWNRWRGHEKFKNGDGRIRLPRFMRYRSS